jgi:hypothetical protein
MRLGFDDVLAGHTIASADIPGIDDKPPMAPDSYPIYGIVIRRDNNRIVSC